LFTAKLHGADYLLLRKHEWDTADRSGAVHWGLIRSLRQTAEKNRGYLDPTSWEQLVTLSSKQSRALMREFPDANSFRRYSDLPRLFQLAAMLSNDEQAKLATTEGIAWDDLSAASRRVASRLWPPEQLATLRLYRNWQLGDEQSPPRLRFSVRGEALREVELRQRIDPRTPEPPLPLPPMSLQEILGTK